MILLAERFDNPSATVSRIKFLTRFQKPKLLQQTHVPSYGLSVALEVGSELRHGDGFSTNGVQDPYSFRCIPVVHGTVRDALHSVENTLVIEMNSVTDNPIVIPEDGSFITGGNFHGEPVALAMESVCGAGKGAPTFQLN